ncbi:MAG: hypothetical protein J6J37_04915 [Bacteroidaceae bacterium]|nr:hypothetical protein [Bacteroidaceae bacterium]
MGGLRADELLHPVVFYAHCGDAGIYDILNGADPRLAPLHTVKDCKIGEGECHIIVRLLRIGFLVKLRIKLARPIQLAVPVNIGTHRAYLNGIEVYELSVFQTLQGKCQTRALHWFQLVNLIPLNFNGGVIGELNLLRRSK